MSAYIEDQSDAWLEQRRAAEQCSLEIASWPKAVRRAIERQILAIEREQGRRAAIRRTDAQAAAQGLTVACVDVTFVDRE